LSSGRLQVALRRSFTTYQNGWCRA